MLFSLPQPTADSASPSGQRLALVPVHSPRDVTASHRQPALPSTWTSTGLSEEAYTKLLTGAVPLLARYGAHLSPEHISQLAASARVSPVCPLLCVPQDLLDEGLRFAFRQIWPREDKERAEGESAEGADRYAEGTPADALRCFVVDTYRRFQANAESVRLITSANLFGGPELHVGPGVLENSPIVLTLDRILMRGQDAGAFREGVSAEDLYVVVVSLCSFPVTSGSTFHTLYGMNATDKTNSAGLERLVADTVLSFLTTTMPTAQGNSYTHFSQSVVVGPSVAASLYSFEVAETASENMSDAASTWPHEQVYGQD